MQSVPDLQLAFEVTGANGNDDSFRIAMDDGDHFDWGTGRDSGGFHWALYQDTFDISQGRHTLHVFGREDGTRSLGAPTHS